MHTAVDARAVGVRAVGVRAVGARAVDARAVEVRAVEGGERKARPLQPDAPHCRLAQEGPGSACHR